LHSASSPNSEVVEQIVFALGAAGLLLSPESAAELEELREQLVRSGDAGAEAFQRAGENGAAAIELRLENERLRERANAAPAALSAEQRAALAENLGDAKPATDGLLVSFGEAIRDRHGHQHGREDWFCLNLSSYMGERMAPVLRRLLDAEARVAELEAELRIGTPWTCGPCGKENTRDVCVVCETDRPDDETVTS
jgi:hypothetical protein